MQNASRGHSAILLMYINRLSVLKTYFFGLLLSDHLRHKSCYSAGHARVHLKTRKNLF